PRLGAEALALRAELHHRRIHRVADPPRAGRIDCRRASRRLRTRAEMSGMRVTARRVRGVIALLAVGAAAGLPPADADPAAGLPPMASSGSGPIIGGGSAAAQGITQQLFSFGNPHIVNEVDGSDAAQFIDSAAGAASQQLAAPFSLLRRAL